MIGLILLAFCSAVPILGFSIKSNAINTITSSHDSEINEQLWEKFKKDYNKSYQSINEAIKRREIFYETLKTIHHHNQVKNNTFKLGINQLADVTFEELYMQNNFDEDEFYETANLDDFEPPESVLLIEESFSKEPPESFDWRDQGLLLPVKNQQQCGSCYAFSSLEAVESQFFIKTGKSFVFSRQEVMDCARSHGTKGCNGGINHGVYSYINKMGGISLQEDYQYTAQEAQCNKNVTRIKFHVKGIAEFEAEDEELLKKALYNEGPVIVVIDTLNESFFRYSSGIYYEEKCNDADRMPTHAILLVGYGSENGNDFWIIKNSYGETWGESGYMRIARNKSNHCKIASLNMIPIIDASSHDQLS